MPPKSQIVTAPEPSGARFFRCALQVNPYAYLERHSKHSTFADEDSYNQALVDKCLELGIDAIGITDHYEVASSASLAKAATDGGIIVFPGFEAVTKDGVHFLCLFDPKARSSKIERRIGECSPGEGESPIGDLDSTELLERAHGDWGAVCIAAHVCGDGGLLTKLTGQTRIAVWRHEDLHACCIAGPTSDAPQHLRTIIENRNTDYKRAYPVAVINAGDVCGPADLEKAGASTYIKMTTPARDGLAQAFLDPESRIRLASDDLPPAHIEFLELSWVGGFLDGVTLPLNENLNVLVGGRGSGKSTVVESVRAVLGLPAVGAEARSNHESLVKNVIRNGTRISMKVRVCSPSERVYDIERTLPSAPVVKDENGDTLALSPLDLLPNAEVYGQHEISEIARDPLQRTQLLDRFLDRSEGAEAVEAAREKLEQAGTNLLSALEKQGRLQGRIDVLPALEETLKRYQDTGLEKKLSNKTRIQEEERLIEEAEGAVAEVRDAVDELRAVGPLESGERAEDALPNEALIKKIPGILKKLSTGIEGAAASLETKIETAETSLSELRSDWSKACEKVEREYQKTLRELKKDSVDSEEFLRLRRDIGRLKPVQAQLSEASEKVKSARAKRATAVSRFEDAKGEAFRELQKAGKRVTRKLDGRVRVDVEFQGSRDPLGDLLRDRVGGQLAQAIETLSKRSGLSLSEFSKACRAGPGELESKFAITGRAAERLASADESVHLAIEELDLPSTTELHLNVSRPGESANWQAMEDLSAGQKATAVLLLLLLESDAPLAIDQPEDDLDNRFITDEVVPRMKQEKRRRQFLFSTHNANIPVLADAELIIGLDAEGDPSGGHVVVRPESVGSIDVPSVRELVESLLEGGKYAFELRRMKYGLS